MRHNLRDIPQGDQRGIGVSTVDRDLQGSRTAIIQMLRESGMDEGEIDLVCRRDWKGMLEHGGSIYLIIKIAGAVGNSLPQVGVHTAGITLEEFQARKRGS